MQAASTTPQGPGAAEGAASLSEEALLEQAEALFHAGDYGSLRKIALKLEASADKEIRSRARELRERPLPSPLTRYLLLLTFLLLVAVTVFAYGK